MHLGEHNPNCKKMDSVHSVYSHNTGVVVGGSFHNVCLLKAGPDQVFRKMQEKVSTRGAGSHLEENPKWSCLSDFSYALRSISFYGE